MARRNRDAAGHPAQRWSPLSLFEHLQLARISSRLQPRTLLRLSLAARRILCLQPIVLISHTIHTTAALIAKWCTICRGRISSAKLLFVHVGNRTETYTHSHSNLHTSSCKGWLNINCQGSTVQPASHWLPHCEAFIIAAHRSSSATMWLSAPRDRSRIDANFHSRGVRLDLLPR